MNIESFRTYCLQKAGVTETFPFDEDTLVFKVLEKMFALTSLSSSTFTINLKCDPEEALELREKYPSVSPGYHMNKKHWNTIDVSMGELSDKELMHWIDHSYDLVVSNMPKKMQATLQKI